MEDYVNEKNRALCEFEQEVSDYIQSTVHYEKRIPSMIEICLTFNIGSETIFPHEYDFYHVANTVHEQVNQAH